MFLEILCVMEYLQIFLFQFIVMSFCACLLMQTFSQNIFWFFSLRGQCLFKQLFINDVAMHLYLMTSNSLCIDFTINCDAGVSVSHTVDSKSVTTPRFSVNAVHRNVIILNELIRKIIYM